VTFHPLAARATRNTVGFDQGQWKDDELDVAADIETSEGRVTRGCINCGRVTEFDCGRLVFDGSYKVYPLQQNPQPLTIPTRLQGRFTSRPRHNSSLGGRRERRRLRARASEALHSVPLPLPPVIYCNNLRRYRYPCRFATVIDGRSTSTRARTRSRLTDTSHVSLTHHTSHSAIRHVREDVSSDRVICRRPLHRDPYESLRVFVDASAGRGEGLFAKVALVKGEVAAFYNGG